MNALLKLFRNKEGQENGSSSLELLFDFVIVAVVSLNFNGFIINSHVAPLQQMFLMVFTAGLIASHWYIHAFFKQRYEKKGLFFRIWTFGKVATLGIMAAGMDLMVFRLNGDQDTRDFLYWFAPLIFTVGITSTRVITVAEFVLAYLANRDKKALVKLTIGKAISRSFVVLLAIAHLTIIAINKGSLIAETTFIFLPIYLVIELVGNFIFVTDKNLKNAPAISVSYAKERFAKLNLLYISSLVVSGSIQFAFYLKHDVDVYMIYRFILNYFIAFLMWWLYADRVYRMNLKISSFSMICFTLLSTLSTMFFAPFGGMVINAYNDTNLHIIIPTALISLSGVIILYNLMMKFLKGEEISRKMKRELVFVSFGFAIIILAIGIMSIFVSLPIWSFYVVIIGSLLALNIHSRIVITRSKRKLR